MQIEGNANITLKKDDGELIKNTRINIYANSDNENFAEDIKEPLKNIFKGVAEQLSDNSFEIEEFESLD